MTVFPHETTHVLLLYGNGAFSAMTARKTVCHKRLSPAISPFFFKCSFPTGFSRVLLQLEEHLIGHSLWRPRVLSTLIHAVNPSSFLNFIEIFNPCLIFAFSRALILDLESAFFHSYWTPFGFLRADPRALTHVSQAISISIFFEHFSSFLTFLNFNVPMRGARSFHIAEWPIAFCTRIHVLMIQGSLLYMLDL